jgi:hypothetical protein
MHRMDERVKVVKVELETWGELTLLLVVWVLFLFFCIARALQAGQK